MFYNSPFGGMSHIVALVSDFKAYPFTLQISVFVCRQQLMIQHQTNEHYICQ